MPINTVNPAYKVIVGRKVAYWEVLKRLPNEPPRYQARYLCRCTGDCAKSKEGATEKSVLGRTLIMALEGKHKGASRSCGCMSKELHGYVHEDLVGKRFHDDSLWTILEEAEPYRAPGQPDRIVAHYWLCECVCGTRKKVLGSAIKEGTSKSCGCIITANISLARRIHQQSLKTKLSGVPTNRISSPAQREASAIKMRQMYEDGILQRRFTPEEVQAIRTAEGTHKEIAKRFGIGKSTVGPIKLGQSYADIEGDTVLSDGPKKWLRLTKREIIDRVRYIRQNRGKKTGRLLAKEIGVTPAMITYIQNGHTYQWVTDGLTKFKPKPR